MLIPTFVSGQLDSVKSRFQKVLQVQSNLYTGFEISPVQIQGDQHPYFFTEDWNLGDLTYDGSSYVQVPLRYDLFRQRLVTEYPANSTPMELIMEKVNEFKIEGAIFQIRSGKGLPQPGFYQILYPGSTEFIAFRRKNYEKRIIAGELFHQYDETNDYYLLHNGKYFKITSKRDFLRVLSDKKKDLRRQRIQGTREQQFIHWASLYDNLTMKQ